MIRMKRLLVSNSRYIEITHISFAFVLADRRRLEIRSTRPGSPVPVDIHDSVRNGYGPDYPAGTQLVRQHPTDRRHVLQDRQEEDGIAQNGE